MRSMFKKISLVISIAFFMLLNCVPLSSFAASVSQVGDKYTITLAEMQKENVGQYYLYYNYWIPWNGGYHSQVYYFYTDVEPTYEKSGNTYTITFTKFPNYSYYLLRDTGSSYDLKKGQSSSIETITYNSDTQIVTCSGGGFSGFEQFDKGATIIDFQTNMFSTEPVLDVEVSFYPDLKGDVDRRASVNGSSSLLQDLKFSIVNNSSFPIQYKFWIDLANPVTTRNGKFDSTNKKTYFETHYDDDPVFVYYSNGQVYSVIDTESADGMYSPQNVALYNKVTEWHYLNSGESFSESFPFSMINLVEGSDYKVHVWAYKCDYDAPSTNLMTSEDTPSQEGYPANPAFKEVDQKYKFHYDEDFKMLQYSDIIYDPNAKSSTGLPYDGSMGISYQEKYRYSYDAKTDLATGKTTIGHVDLYDDPNSWVNKNYNYSSSSSYGGKSSFSFSNLLASSSAFFSFLSAALGFFPSILLEVVSLSLVSILVFAILRRLH